MRLITITSDWSSTNYYLAALKAKLYSTCAQVQVVDISHQISLFSIREAAFIVRHCLKHFPDGTVHLMAVDAEITDKKPLLLVQANNQFFIGTDNGMFGLLFDQQIQQIARFNPQAFKDSSFPELDVFAEAAAMLCNNKLEENAIEEHAAFKRLPAMLPIIEKTLLLGKVIYIDSYLNLVTNIDKQLFEQQTKNRSFTITVQSKRNKIEQISKKYSDVPEGDLVALFNSVDLLELAINRGKIAELLNLDTQSVIRIDFYDNTNSKDGLQSGTLF